MSSKLARDEESQRLSHLNISPNINYDDLLIDRPSDLPNPEAGLEKSFPEITPIKFSEENPEIVSEKPNHEILVPESPEKIFVDQDPTPIPESERLPEPEKLWDPATKLETYLRLKTLVNKSDRE